MFDLILASVSLKDTSNKNKAIVTKFILIHFLLIDNFESLINSFFYEILEI